MMGIGNPVYDMIQTPFIQTKKRILSGCSTNACIVSALLNNNAVLVGCIGEDFRKKTEHILSTFGVTPVLYPSQETGGFSLKYINGDRELNVLGRADSIVKIPKNNADVILFGPILQEIAPSLVVTASETNAVLFCDPQGFLRDIKNKTITHMFPPEFKEILPLFDILKPNELETHVITQENVLKAPEKVMEALYELGPSICIVTLAEKGSLIYDGSELLKIPAFKTTAKDPTGAGDTYAAGFITEYLRSKNVYEAGLFASCTASLWVEDIGPYIEITEEKVKKRVRILKEGGTGKGELL
jgi:sugar/nucleoside kinase (ribokinase family)